MATDLMAMVKSQGEAVRSGHSSNPQAF